MSRLLLLLILVGWFSAEADPPAAVALGPISRQILIFGGFGLIVLIPALWSRVLARHIAIANLYRSLNRYGWGTAIARIMIPVWFGVTVYSLGWVEIVYRGLGPVARWPVELPAAFLGTLPAMIAWAALWWAAYPADRALREQSLLLQLQDGLPIHAPPGFWSYFAAKLRMDLLFTIIPILVILLLRDVMSLALAWGFHVNIQGPRSTVAESSNSQLAHIAEWFLLPLAGLAVFIMAPEILRHVLQTQPLSDSPLRRRLEAICRRNKLRYRDILLWRTGNHMGNAAVMGVLPQVRYILLSDLLLQTMTDRQIEAVFAHEAGHVVHRHLVWYGVFVVITMMAILMVANLADALHIDFHFIPMWLKDPLQLGVMMALFLLMFGVLSRCFERQADVFAARTMERELNDENESSAAAPSRVDNPSVGLLGADLFASALQRVALVNNIPIRANNFSHGSIAHRMRYVRYLSTDPANTQRFDRFMKIVFRCLSAALLISAAWAGFMFWKS